MFSLNDRIAVVTGGSGDLGFAIADAYSAAGAFVILVGRDKSKLDISLNNISHPNKSISIVCDVRDEAQVEKMVEEVLIRYGKIDILLTAAGIQHRSPVINFGGDDWLRVLDTNLNGTFYCAKAVARHMVVNNSGRIIFISSLTSEIGIPNIAAYAASRGGIKQLSKTMAVELAPLGITVNCIGPGRFLTPMTKDLFDDPSKRESFLSVIPMKRPGVPKDLAGLAVFLASDASSYITGQSIYVDGGWLAGGGNIRG